MVAFGAEYLKTPSLKPDPQPYLFSEEMGGRAREESERARNLSWREEEEGERHKARPWERGEEEKALLIFVWAGMHDGPKYMGGREGKKRASPVYMTTCACEKETIPSVFK